MAKNFMQTVKTFLSKWGLVLVIALVLLWAINQYSGSKLFNLDGMKTGTPEKEEKKEEEAGAAPEAAPAPAAEAGYAMQPVANPADLLPKDENSKFAELNPANLNTGDVMVPDLLQAGYHVGLDTVGQTMKNANLQLRSDPVIAKKDVGPWNNSTIEADVVRQEMEIGK